MAFMNILGGVLKNESDFWPNMPVFSPQLSYDVGFLFWYVDIYLNMLASTASLRFSVASAWACDGQNLKKGNKGLLQPP